MGISLTNRTAAQVFVAHVVLGKFSLCFCSLDSGDTVSPRFREKKYKA
jgi:hypothetical protein